jgi:hypothetical protein
MTTLHSLILPSFIDLLPIILFSIYRIFIKTKIRRKILISGIILFFIGLIVPWIATFVSAIGLASEMPQGPKCVTGAAIFFFFGYIVNLIGIPFLGIIFYLTGKNE